MRLPSADCAGHARLRGKTRPTVPDDFRYVGRKLHLLSSFARVVARRSNRASARSGLVRPDGESTFQFGCVAGEPAGCSGTGPSTAAAVGSGTAGRVAEEASGTR